MNGFPTGPAQKGDRKAGEETVGGILTNRRLAQTLIILTLLAVTLVGWLLFAMRGVSSEARTRFFEQYNRQQLLLAQQAARTLEELFETFHHDLSLVAGFFEGGEVNSRRVKELDPTLRKIFKSLSSTPAIDMAIFDANGIVIASYPPSPGTVGVNLAWRDYFKEVRDRGKPHQLYLTSFRTMSAGKAKGQKALIVLEGIYGEKGNFKGLVIFTLNFDELAKKYILPVHIGKNGYAWLLDASNRMTLVDPRNQVDDRSIEAAFLPKWPRLYTLLTTVDLNKAGTGWYEYEDPEDPTKEVRKHVGYSPVRIGEYRWLLGVATPENEIEALLGTFIRRQENFSVSVAVSILVGALVACALLVAWNSMLSRRVLSKTRDLEDARAELVAAEKFAAVGHLALGLTHEIRNPLSAIRMNVQMIRQESPDNELLQENFKIIEEEILRLNRLLGDVMGFARPRPLTLGRVDLCTLAERVSSLMARQLSEAGVELSLSTEGAVDVICDSEQIQQVILNLTLNSMAALEDIPLPRMIIMEVKRLEETAILRVIDNGAGIKKEMLGKIFNAFYTTKAQGGGLGLATVQSIVLRHGGGVDVESDGASGSVFTVRLPLNGPPKHEESQA